MFGLIGKEISRRSIDEGKDWRDDARNLSELGELVISRKSGQPLTFRAGSKCASRTIAVSHFVPETWSRD